MEKYNELIRRLDALEKRQKDIERKYNVSKEPESKSKKHKLFKKT